MRRLAFLLLVLASCGSETVPGDRPDPDILATGGTVTVTGRVVDSVGTPVPNAFVLIQSDPVEVTTDAGGTFSAELAAGEHNLSVTKWGETFIDTGITVPPEETHDLGDVGPTNPFIYARMNLREAAYLRTRFHQAHTWTALNIEDQVGVAVPGLTMTDFTVTDSIREIATGNVVASNVIDIPTQNANPFYEAGVWEHQRTREKLDIVFFVDGTGSMNDVVDGVKANIHDFVDRLQTAHLDFRVAAINFQQNPGTAFNYIVPFMGDWQIEQLHDEIESKLGAAGEGWSPTAAYDALMLTEWLDYRDDARKVAVIVTDIVPHTVYGNYWYTVTSTVMTKSAIEQFIADEEIELYFAQDPTDHLDVEYYVDPDINPRAGDTESGLFGLAGDGFATVLHWPFDEVELSNALGLVADDPVIDSQYLVEWQPVVGWELPWRDAPGDYEQFVTVAIDDPARPGETLSASFTLPLETPTTDVAINVLAEEDNDPDGMRADLFRLCGGRPVDHSGQLVPSGGVISLQVPPGRYRVEVYDGGQHSFDDESLNAIGRADFEVGADPVSVDVPVKIGEARGELARARGLLRDLDDWRISGDPFRESVAEAEGWLSDIEEGGLSWQEMVQLRRFNVALAGYANLTEYVQLETASAVGDFQNIVADFRDVVKQIQKLNATTHDKWYTELAGALIDAVMAYITQGEFTQQEKLLEVALKALSTYLDGPLQKELKKHVVDQFPADGEIFESLYTFTLVLLDAEFNSNDQDADWGKVIEAASKIALDAALIAARHTIVEDEIDAIVDQIPVDNAVEQDIKGLLRDILNSLIRRNHDMKDFQRALERFARNIGQTLLTEDREVTIATINRMYDFVQAHLGGYPDVRDFVVGLARDLTLAALPEVDEHNHVRFEIDTDEVVTVLIQYGLYNVVLRHYYVQEANRGLVSALRGAQNYTVPAGDRVDWESAMASDFADYRATVGGVQDTAWDALRVQDAVDGWANGLQQLARILQALSGPLDFIAAVYQPLQDTADEVHAFIAVLDGIHITTEAISFGLKLDCMSRFGNITKDLYAEAYPH